MSDKVSLNMRAGHTSRLKTHNTWKVAPFNNLLVPPLTAFSTSPLLLKQKHHANFDSFITLCVAIGRIYIQINCTGNVCSDWHEDVGSNICGHLLFFQCFLLSSAGCRVTGSKSNSVCTASLGFRNLLPRP